jgi:hypothetical protein
MNISGYPVRVIAERVCIHKFAFAAARTISLGAGFAGNAAPYFIRSDAKTLSKYKRMADHHALMRFSPTKSQHTSSTLPFMTFSNVSAQ